MLKLKFRKAILWKSKLTVCLMSVTGLDHIKAHFKEKILHMGIGVFKNGNFKHKYGKGISQEIRKISVCWYPGYVFGEGQLPCSPGIFTVQSRRYHSGSTVMRKSTRNMASKREET